MNWWMRLCPFLYDLLSSLAFYEPDQIKSWWSNKYQQSTTQCLIKLIGNRQFNDIGNEESTILSSDDT